MNLNVLCNNDEQLYSALSCEYVDEIIIEADGFEGSQTEVCHEVGKKAAIALPYIFRDLSFVDVSDYDEVYVRSVDELEYAAGYSMVSDYGLYSMNEYAAEVLKQSGVKRITAPVELNYHELAELGCEDKELIVYGHIPMMISAQCIHKNTGKCDHTPIIEWITDRTGKRLPVENRCAYCYNLIYNAVPTVLFDQKASEQIKADSLRFEFTVESAAETAKILYNALVSDYLVTKTQNGSVIQVTSSIIEEVFGYSIVDATVIATNDYAVNGNTVVKNGYVTLLANDGGKEFTMTVPADDLHMKGSANENIGRTFKVICRGENGKYSVLSSVQTTNVELYESFVINKNGTVSIGDNNYTLVDKLSDELYTNANELMLYVIGTDGKIELIPNAEALDKLEGFVRIELMSNDGKISHGIVKNYKMATLEIGKDGSINLAGGMKQDKINMVAPNGTKNGDVVLYRWNENARELEIAVVLKAVSGKVVRLTNNAVMIGDMIYALGNEKAGISAESVKKMLSLGSDVTVLVHNGAVLMVLDGVKVLEDGKYMISVTNARLVYENGMFRYVMTAYVDGEIKNVYVRNADGKAGYVYRYTENDGVYSIVELRRNNNNIISGAGEFIQSDSEIGFAVIGADKTTITLSGKGLYTLSAGNADYASSNGENKVQFVTDENTVIIVRNNGVMKQISGKYASTINVNDGAVIVAVMNDEVGAVETLRYMYVSDGSLGNYDVDAQSVRVLEKNGMVFVNGGVYTEYTVYSFADGEVKTMLSKNNDLAVGGDYRLGADGTITSDKAAEMQSGVVTGYTAGTVSVNAETYSVNPEMKVIVLSSDNKVSSATVSEMYGKNVEYIVSNGEVVFMLMHEVEVND